MLAGLLELPASTIGAVLRRWDMPYLRQLDRLTGEISPVSVNNRGEIADGYSVEADVSRAGRFVVFTAYGASNLGPSPDPAVFLRRLR